MIARLLYLTFVFAVVLQFPSCKSDIQAESLHRDNTNLYQLSLSEDKITCVYPWVSDYKVESSIANNIDVLNGYERPLLVEGSFEKWLRHLPCEPSDDRVYLYNGDLKRNQTAQFKVIDIDIGNKDLQQCADAIMRLRAEYLYSIGQFDKVHFNYTNGTRIDFNKWAKGFYPYLKSNKVVWGVSTKNDYSYESFKKYLYNVFTYAGTSSLEKEMIKKGLSDLKPGDVFIKGGFPGHAVIVVDVIVSKQYNDKCFLLAQSYMPAQSIHVLKNPTNSEISPWYALKDVESELRTPEWTFSSNSLRRFEP